MTMIVRIDDLYINLDNVTRITVSEEHEEVIITFITPTCNGSVMDYCQLYGERGARLLKWLDEGGRVSEA